MNKRAPTRRELDALSAIAAYLGEHGYPPTVRELAGLLVLSFQRAQQLLDACERVGLIEITRHVKRGIRITDAGTLALVELLIAEVHQSTSASPRVDIPRELGICRECGCTDEHACVGGCSWANPEHTLCSACNAVVFVIEVV